MDLLLGLLVILEELDDLLVGDFATMIDVEIGESFLKVLALHKLVIAEPSDKKLCVFDLATAVCVYNVH